MKYAKLYVALAAAAAVGVSVTADQSVSVNDVFAIASAFFGALGVGLVANKTQ